MGGLHLTRARSDNSLDYPRVVAKDESGPRFAPETGQADPSFTLRTYVHLMDAGVGDADFLDRAVVAEATTDALPKAAISF